MTTHKRYSTSQKMADLLLDDSRLLTLFERMGIRLGFGKRSVEEVCEESGVSPNLLVAMCNIIAERDTTPDVRSLGKEELRAIVDYLRLSHINYTDHYFPTLHSHIHTMAAGLSEKQQQTINSFYDIYEASVMNHFHHEEQVVFPYINSLIEGEKVENYSIGEFAKTHSDIDERLADLLNIIVKYLPDNDEDMASHTVLRDIFHIEEELDKHTLIENCLLVPLAEHIERGEVEVSAESGKEDYSADKAEVTDDERTGELSAREKDIVIAVAGGATNKEIADRLNISVHTVVTHRKNITRKLGIRSISGLTVYAIMNNLIEVGG